MSELEQAYQQYEQHLEDTPQRDEYVSFEEFSLAVDRWLCEYHRLFNRVYMAQLRANTADREASQ